jgi:hypothetical protein
LRDDIKDLFDGLFKLLDSKKNLLNNLLENEKSASDLIKYRNDAEDDLLKIIEHETEIIEKINVEDFNISQIRDQISRRYSLDFDKILNKDYSTSEKEILDYRNEILQHHNLISEIIILKKENSSSMNKTRNDLEVQISELERMGRLKIIYPKGLRSS